MDGVTRGLAAMPDRSVLAARGRRLEYFTIGWNSVEGVIGVAAGAMAGSISLVGFGVDSFIEVASGAALLWRMAADADVDRREHVEYLARRIVGACFVALAVYVTVEALGALAERGAPAPSLPGIVLACAALVVMPILSRAKHRVGHALRSDAMRADANQATFCSYLSAILLGGLLLNSLWGLWWADPAAGLVMAPIIAQEGVNGLRAKRCC